MSVDQVRAGMPESRDEDGHCAQALKWLLWRASASRVQGVQDSAWVLLWRAVAAKYRSSTEWRKVGLSPSSCQCWCLMRSRTPLQDSRNVRHDQTAVSRSNVFTYKYIQEAAYAPVTPAIASQEMLKDNQGSPPSYLRDLTPAS